MHRRNLLLLAPALALGACQWLPPPPLTVVCDPELVPMMEKAAGAWPGRRGGDIQIKTDISPRMLATMMDQAKGVVVATRDDKNANRLQRTAHVRLADRWKRESADGPVALLITRGEYLVEYQSRKFAEWIAGPEADSIFNPSAPPVSRAV